MIEKMSTGKETILPPGNVIEVPDKVLGSTIRIATAHHDLETTEEEVGPLSEIHCFALENAGRKEYEDASTPAFVVARAPSLGPYQYIRTAAEKTGCSMFFVDMSLSAAANKFEERRRFLTFMVGGTLGATTAARSDVSVSIRAAAAGILLWTVGPEIADAAFSSKGPSDLRTSRGKAWRAASTIRQTIRPGGLRFTLELRNDLITYKTRCASRLQDERNKKVRSVMSEADKKTQLTIGQGHQLIAGLFLNKTDEELLADIGVNLARLARVDTADKGMWSSISKITEVWFTKNIDKNAHASFLVSRGGIVGDTFVHATIHEDVRLQQLVKEILAS